MVAEYRVPKRSSISAQIYLKRAFEKVSKLVVFWPRLNSAHPRVLRWLLEPFGTQLNTPLKHTPWLSMGDHSDAFWYPVFGDYFG